ncbi:hypothetical protein CcaverHIS631_0502560 [Cutaneotrichosporon cavernicola]|nr:hypothetical protein CcaverHIS631_0502560 [Cutaneotrichosporon cavernicola]BEJ08169.1 hypothetical protein CcaverHIS641_0502540 [Cutaneotrichosporon cavernicola]
MYLGLQRRPPNLPEVPVMYTASDVLAALTHQSWSDKRYEFAIVNSYVEHKQVRGRTKAEIIVKLEVLERQVPPRFAEAFFDVRAHHGLPESRVIRLVRVSKTTSTDRASSVRHPSSSSSSTRLNRASTMTAASSRPPRPAVELPPPVEPRQTVPPTDGEGDDLPPPPYTAEDPDPDLTQAFQEQISAVEAAEEANAATRESSALERVESNTSRNPRRSNDFSAMPAPAENTDELSADERRAREDSIREEEMRIARVEEKERLEYEAAIQASLASAEEDSARRDLYEEIDLQGAGPGPSSSGQRTNAPISSLSHATLSHAPSAEMSGSINPDIHKAQPPLPQDNALEEMFGGFELNSPTLQPIPASPSEKNKQRRSGNQSTMFQSNNPFLTPEEREQQQQEQMDAAAARSLSPQRLSVPQTQHDFSTPPAVPPRPSSCSSPRVPPTVIPRRTPSIQTPGCALPPQSGGKAYGTQYNTYGVGRPQYATPPGPPPNWQHYQPPPGPPPWLQSEPSRSHVAVTGPSRNGMADPQSFTTVVKRPSRPLPHPVGPPRVVPGPAAVNHIRQVSGARWREPDNSDPSSELCNTPDRSPDVGPTVPPAAKRYPSPAFLDATGENALEMLADYDTVFLIDDSTSMAGQRWEQMQKAVMGVVQQAVRYDRNGVDCYFLNSKRIGKGLRVAQDVEDLFAGLQPRGATPTGLRMEAILRDYMSRLEGSVAAGDEDVPSMNLIVVTDGAFAHPLAARLRFLAADPSLDRASLMDAAPTDDLESVIVSVARRLDRGDFPLSQVGVQLLQIGCDSEAREALQELDDGLAAAHGVRDMVDTVPYNGEELTSDLIVKVLLGGINRRLDRRG